MKRLDCIEITENSVSEYDREKKVVSISKDNIDTISLEYGFCEERPIISIIVGLLLLTVGVLVGLIPVLGLLKSLIDGEPVRGNIGPFALAIPLLFMGTWYVLKVFKNRWFLKIVTGSATRKLSFGKETETATIESFLRECSRSFGYNILLNSKREHYFLGPMRLTSIMYPSILVMKGLKISEVRHSILIKPKSH